MRPRDQGPSGGDTRAACGEHQARQNKPHLVATSRRTASLETYGSACLRRSRISSCRSLEEDSDSTRCVSPLPCEVGCTGPDFFNLPPAAFSVKLNVSCSRAFDSDDSDSSPSRLPDPQFPPEDTDPAAVNGVKAVTLPAAVSEDAQPLVKQSAQPERLSPDSQTALKGSRYEEQEEEAEEEEAKTTSASSAIAAIQKLSLEGAQQQVDSRTAFMAQRKSVKELYGQPSWWGDDEVEDTRPPPSVAHSLADKSNSADDVEKCKAPPSPQSTVAATPRRPAEAFTVDFGGNSMSSIDRRRRRPPPPPLPPPQPSRLVSRGRLENTTRQPRTTTATVSAPRRGIGPSERTTPQRDLQRTRPATANTATRARPRVGISGRTPQQQRQQQQSDQRRPLSARPAAPSAAVQTPRGGAVAIKSSSPTPALQRRSTASSSVTRGARGNLTKTAISRRATESSLGTHSPGPSSPTTSSRLLQRNRIPLRRGSTNSASPKVATTAVQPPAAVSPRFAPVSAARGQSAGQPAVRAGEAGVRGASMTPTTRRLPPATEATGKQPKPSPGVTEQPEIKSRAAATGAPPSSRPTRTLFNSLKKPTTVFPSQSAASASGKHRSSPSTAEVSEASGTIPGAADSVAAYIMSFEDPKDYLFDQMFSGINLTHQCSTNNVFQAFNRGAAAQRESPEVVVAAAAAGEEEELNGCVRTVPDEKTGQAMAASSPLPDEPPVEVASNIASNLENFGRTFTRKKLPSNQFAHYWQNSPPLPTTTQPEIKSTVHADVDTHATQPTVEITPPEATTSSLTKARTPSPPLDANLCQAVSVDSLAPSCAGTYILDVNDTLAAEGIPPVVIGEKAEESSEIANIMITSNTCTLPHRRSPSPAIAGSRDSLDRVNVDNPDEEWEERRNGENLQVNDVHLKEAFLFNREETQGGMKSAAMDKGRFTKTSEEIELKTYGNSHHHDISSSNRQSHSNYADRTAPTAQQTPQPSKQRAGVVESDRQSKRHQARADKSAKNAVSAFGKHVKNGHAFRERSSSNSISCSRADVRHSVSSGFMDVAPETSMLTASDSQHEHLRSPPLPPTSYTGQCSCMPPPPYTAQDSRLLSTLPDHDQFLRYGGARSNSCSSASPQLIDQLKDEFDQALADICYHSETYSGYTGLPEYSNTAHSSQCQNETFSFSQLRDFDFDSRSQNQQPPVQPPQRLTDVGVDYPQTSGYFTQGYARLEAFQQPPDLVSPTQEQRRSAFRPYEVCPPSVQPRALAPLIASDVPCCFRQSSRARSPSRISPQAASLAPALRKRNSWDWEWTETSGAGMGEGLRRHSSRSSVHSEIAGPSYMPSSSAAAAAVWRSRRLRRQPVGEDYRQPPLCQKNVSAARVGASGGRTTATQYLPMRSAISAASLDTDVLTQELADALTDAVRHGYNGMPPNNAVQDSVASSLPGNQSIGRGNEFATNKADTGVGAIERIPFADEVVTSGVSASNNLAERPSAFTRLVTNCEPLPPGLNHTVLSRRVIPPPLSMKLFNESAVAPPSDPQRLEKNASMESPSCGSLSAATPGVRGTTLSSPLTRSAIFCADSSDSGSVLTYSPPSLSCISDHVIPTGVRKNQRSLTKRFCPRRHSLRTGSANTRHPRADSPTAEDITNNGYSPPYSGLISKQRCPPGVSDPLTITATSSVNSTVPTPGAVAVASTPGRGAGTLSKLVIPTSTGHSEATINAVTGCTNSGALGRYSRQPVSTGERQEHQQQTTFPDSLSSGGIKTDVYVTAIATTSSSHHQAGLDPAVMPPTVNGVRPGGCFDEFSIQRPIAKRLDPEDHRLFALAYPQNFTPSSSSSSAAVGAASQADTQPLLRCLGPEQRSNLAERSRRSISLGPTDHSPTDFYLDTSGSGFRLSSTALADPPKESYETLLASSILHLSNRLRRCSNSLAQRIGAAGCENSGSALESSGLPTARTGISSSASPLQEGNDLLTNMREVEQQLQHMESILFPLSKSGRTSVTGSCAETEYLQELERINSEISGFVPITAIKADADESSPLTKTQASATTITKRPLASTTNNQQWRPAAAEGEAQNDTGNLQEDPLLTEEYY